MLKNKLDFKLVNFFLVLLIILVIYIMRSVWFFFINVIIEVLKPIVISLIISYFFNLYLKKLNMFFNKYVSVFVFLITIFLFIFVLYRLFGQIIEQVNSSSLIVIDFIKNLLLKYNLDVFSFYDKVEVITGFFSKFLNNFFGYFSLLVVIVSSSIYFFIDFNKIKCFLKRLSIYSYLVAVNKDIESYSYSFLLLSIINVIEYTFVFFIIGHPNYLFLGLLSGVLSLVPMFGGVITNCVACITSFIFNYRLFIRTLIGILVLTILDGYVISPIIYSKSNRMHPLVIILSIYIGGRLFGIVGVVFALPVLVLVLSSYNFFKNR